MDLTRIELTEAASWLKLNLETLKLKQVFFPSGSTTSSRKALRFADSSRIHLLGLVCNTIKEIGLCHLTFFIGSIRFNRDGV